MRNENEYFASFCGVSVDGEFIIVLVRKRFIKKIQLWLHSDFAKKPYKLNLIDENIIKSEKLNNEFLSLDICIDDLPLQFQQEGENLKITFDIFGKQILKGKKQPFKIPKKVHDVYEILGLNQKNKNDQIPSKIKKACEKLKLYAGYYRNWYSYSHLREPPVSYDPEINVLTISGTFNKALNPHNKEVPVNWLNSLSEGSINTSVPNCDFIDNNYSKIVDLKLLSEGWSLYPDNLIPSFRQRLLDFSLSNIPRISVIVPNWNREYSCLRAIDSILNQTVEPLEIIVCDDGSSDDSVKNIKSRFPDAISRGKLILLEEEHRGVSAARNTAMRKAKGDWFCYLDTDNMWHPDHILYFIYVINFLNRQAKILYTSRDLYSPRIKKRQLPLKLFNYNELKKGNFIDLNCLMHNRSFFDSYGGFNESLKRLVDWDLILKYSKDCALYEVSSINISSVIYWRSRKFHKNISNTRDINQPIKFISDKYKDF